MPMKMTFGKYKGLELSDIPRDYLRWVVTTLSVDHGLFVAIESVIGKVGDAKSGRDKAVAMAQALYDEYPIYRRFPLQGEGRVDH